MNCGWGAWLAHLVEHGTLDLRVVSLSHRVGIEFTFFLKEEDQKISLALTLPDNLPGALYKALSTFAWRGIDLTKIESRPLKTILGEYFFIIDFENHNEKLVSFALEELTSIGIHYKILGKYAVYRL